MKKLFLLFITFYINVAIAQTPAMVGGIEAPKEVTEKFTKQHPEITPNWSKENKNYKATYEDPKTAKQVIIVYDKNGEVIRKESELDNMDYPKQIHEYYSKNYPEEKYKTWSVQDHTGVNSYYVNHGPEIIWFDKDGKYIPDQKPKKSFRKK
ncbi:MAG: hypothetical protein ABIP51_18505 [Bacteroidia bacterium]